MGRRRGFGVAWTIFFIILLILLVALLPGMVSVNNDALSGFENKGDPSYLLVSIVPFFFFAYLLFKAVGLGANT